MKTKGIKGLIVITILAVVALGLVTWKGYQPVLGLDLQGGVMVVLKPKGNPGPEQLDTAILIMNNRINSIGVAEPDIRQENGRIVVQIAGIKDKDAAIKLVGETAELRFRAVLADLPPFQDPTTVGSTPGSTPGTEVPGTDVPGTTPATAVPGSVPDPTVVTTAPGAASIDAGPSTTSTATAGPQALALVPGESASATQEPSTSSTVSDTGTPTSVAIPTGASTGTSQGSVPGASETPPGSVPEGTATSVPLDTEAACRSAETQAVSQIAAVPNKALIPTTTLEDDLPNTVVALPVYRDEDLLKPINERQVERRVLLGCSRLTGEALEDASASLQEGKWTVNPRFKAGDEGIDQFNAISAKCFAGSPECPTKRLAITLDGAVITDPSINVASFKADQIQISGSFTEATARDVATKLKFGALPVVLEREQVVEVSATLGQDALHAGLVAGGVGLGLVILYMIAFYRMLGVLAMAKLAVEAALLWSIIAWLGDSAGLTLTLAGLTGIIVSIGVSLDSNVVYYEHLKEDIRNGRTYRSAVDKAFDGAFKTIVKADGVSVLGAVLLYFLSVGPVRGFAFFLGVSAVLDLLASYYYMRPFVALALKSDLAQRRPGLFGLPRPEEVENTTLAKVSRRAKGTTVAAESANAAKRSTGGTTEEVPS